MAGCVGRGILRRQLQCVGAPPFLAQVKVWQCTQRSHTASATVAHHCCRSSVGGCHVMARSCAGRAHTRHSGREGSLAAIPAAGAAMSGQGSHCRCTLSMKSNSFSAVAGSSSTARTRSARMAGCQMQQCACRSADLVHSVLLNQHDTWPSRQADERWRWAPTGQPQKTSKKAERKVRKNSAHTSGLATTSRRRWPAEGMPWGCPLGAKRQRRPMSSNTRWESRGPGLNVTDMVQGPNVSQLPPSWRLRSWAMDCGDPSTWLDTNLNDLKSSRTAGAAACRATASWSPRLPWRSSWMVLCRSCGSSAPMRATASASMRSFMSDHLLTWCRCRVLMRAAARCGLKGVPGGRARVSSSSTHDSSDILSGRKPVALGKASGWLRNQYAQL